MHSFLSSIPTPGFILVTTVVLLFMVSHNEALAAASSPKKVVLVSGAGGQTGQALFRKLLALPDEFVPIGLVRSETSQQALLDSGIPPEAIALCDVTNPKAVNQVVLSAQKEEGKKIDAFCICTSAKPAPSAEVNPETGRPDFTFPNGDPEVVDWMGQKNQIDACPSGTHIVLCSTMGGTDPDHSLNKLGLVIDEKTGEKKGGMIVQWKRKSEMYLQAQKDKTYTIVHPGGLLNEEGGERELIAGIDDDMTYGGNSESRTVPRSDVAQVMLEALRHSSQYGNRSFDLRAKAVGEGQPTTDFGSLLDPLKGKNCDYALGETM